MKKNRKVILIFLGNFAGSTASLLLEQILKDTEQEDIFFTNPPLLPIVIHQDPFLQKELLKDFSSFVKTNWFVQLEEKLTYISDGEEFQFLHHIIEEEYKGKDVLFSIMFSPISEYDTLKLNSLFRFINTNYPESNRLLISLKPSTSSAGPTAPYYELVTLYLALHHSNALLLWDEDAISNVLNYHNKQAKLLEKNELTFKEIILNGLRSLFKMEWTKELTYGYVEELTLNLVRFSHVKLLSMRMINQIKMEEKNPPFNNYYPAIMNHANLSTTEDIEAYPSLSMNFLFTGKTIDARYFIETERKIMQDIKSSSFSKFQVNRYIASESWGQFCIIENNSWIVQYLIKLEKAFLRIFERKAFLHSLRDQDLTEDDLLIMFKDLKAIIMAYNECGENLELLIT